MADTKITDFTELTGAAYEEDVLEIVDVSATTNKKIKASNLLGPAAAEETGASYTFGLADAFKTKIFNSASAQAITIPTNTNVAFPIGTRIRCFRKGAGLPKISPDTGVTLQLPTGIKPNRFMGVKAVHAGATGQNWSSDTAVPLAGADAYDTDAFHDPASNNTRLTIPANLGIKKVNLSGAVYANNFTATQWQALYFRKGGSTNYAFQNFYQSVGVAQITNSAIGVDVADSNYLEMLYRTQTDTSIDPTADTFFALEVAEIDAQGYIAYRYGSVELEKIGINEWIFVDQTALG